MADWPVHPAAELFPLLGDAELTELADDIRANGLIEPVWLFDDPQLGTVLLDGRNRAQACEIAGVRVETRRYTGDDPITFSISQNLKRRHLTAGQRAFLALAAEQLYAAEAAKRKGLSPGRPRKENVKHVADLPHVIPPPDTPGGYWITPPKAARAPLARERAAAVGKTSGRVVAQAKRISQKAPDLAEKVTSGAMPIDRADRIIRDREAEARRVQLRLGQVVQPQRPHTADSPHSGDEAHAARSPSRTRSAESRWCSTRPLSSNLTARSPSSRTTSPPCGPSIMLSQRVQPCSVSLSSK